MESAKNIAIYCCLSQKGGGERENKWIINIYMDSWICLDRITTSFRSMDASWERKRAMKLERNSKGT